LPRLGTLRRVSSSPVPVRTPDATSHYSLLLTDDLPGAPRTDADRFDGFGEHLAVRDDTTGEVVGSCRLLPPERAAAAGGLSLQDGFEIDALAPLRPSLVEVGRPWVHPDHRHDPVVAQLRAGVAGYLLLTGHRWAVGRVGVGLDDGGRLAATAWDRALARHLAPAGHRVRPLRMWDPTGVPRKLRAQSPPLLRGCLRLGGWICGAPAHDPGAGRVDFPVLLGLDHVDQRRLRHALTSGRARVSRP
jgi:putative hemolysin